jgi:hypothetical protein
MFQAMAAAGGYVLVRATETGGVHVVGRDRARGVVHIGVAERHEEAVRRALDQCEVQPLEWALADLRVTHLTMTTHPMPENDFEWEKPAPKAEKPAPKDAEKPAKK